MNARQKAKHYKRLYEQMKLPIHTIDRTNLQYYRIEKMIPFASEYSSPELVERMLVNSVLDTLKPKIRENIAYQTDPYYRKVVAVLDIWLKQ